jgi:hypothetical protein
MRVRSVLVLLLALAPAGCYAHRPVEFSAAPSGEVVRVHLTDAGVRHMEETFGVRQRQIQGEILTAAQDHLLLAFTPPPPPGTRGAPTTRREFRVAPGQISEVEVRELDRKRTTALFVGGGLVLSLGFYLVTVADSGGPLQGPGGPGDFLRVPIRIP